MMPKPLLNLNEVYNFTPFSLIKLQLKVVIWLLKSYLSVIQLLFPFQFRVYLVLRYLFLFVFIPFSSQTQSTEITVAAPEIFPFVYLDNEHKPTGLFVDCLKSNVNTDYSYKVLVLPWARALEEVKNNRINALMPTMYTEQRAEYLSYPTEPLVYFLDDVLVQRKTSSFVSFKQAVANKKIIAKVRSTTLTENLKYEVNLGNVDLFLVKDIASGLAMLEQGRIDYLVGDYHIIKYTAQQSQLADQFTFVSFTNEKIPSYLSFSKNFSKNNDINKIMSGVNCGANLAGKFKH